MAAHLVAQHLRLREPELLFHASEANYRSSNPIEGLLRWGPFDASIPGYLRPNPLRVAVISTQNGVDRLFHHLQNLNTTIELRKPHEYLRDYPGFRTVYQTNLSFPEDKLSKFTSLITNEEIEAASHHRQPEIAFLEVLKNRIRRFVPEMHLFDVLVIHIPQEASIFRTKIEADYRFDLHDALKAYCAPNGLKIQVIEDKSLSYAEPSQVYWWLSLALYVKANGIPWKLAEPMGQTAYVGLTYGIKLGIGGQRIVLGCSQVFDERGAALRFLLLPLENPVWRRRNPFMNQEDARRLFTQVREMYQAFNQQRPRRVVVHKTTYFSSDEINGISEALEGIEEMELITINQRVKYRAIMFDPTRDQVSMFPVQRSSVLPLDVRSFLLWTMGDVMGIGTHGRHYYQEMRGIPSPLMITRYRGRSPIEEVALDILKLTKMNWNNLQLYSRLPVTLAFAAKISEIVKQIDDYLAIPYDFRYFI
jgi:hypothetical protein